MKITSGRDFWAGLMFMAFGLGFLIVARNYAMGNAVRMGPSYFPTMLGGILAVLGAIIFFRAFVSKISTPLRSFPFRPLIFAGGVVLGAIALFSMDVRNHGMAALIAHMLLSGLAIGLLFAAFGPKALWVLMVSVILFGYMLKPMGLVLATGLLIFGSALGGHEFKVKEVTIMFIVLAIFSWVAFIKGLQLPMNIWPAFLE